jgi:hypothetical protein
MDFLRFSTAMPVVEPNVARRGAFLCSADELCGDSWSLLPRVSAAASLKIEQGRCPKMSV